MCYLSHSTIDSSFEGIKMGPSSGSGRLGTEEPASPVAMIPRSPKYLTYQAAKSA